MFRLPRLETRRSLSRIPLALALIPLLSSCNMVVLNPAGDVAQQQGNLVLISTAMMLLIIVPVMILTVLFAWRYRAANKADVPYEPDWDHSTQLELVIWGAPLLIIICLGALTWVATHLLDPYRPLARTAPGQMVAAGVKPLEVDVVALDWKWLFIYPEYGIATVNELAAPTDRPIQFRISSSSVMNSFYIPALAGQIYAMPGMETKLHAVFNRPGTYEGFSANFSGAGFSHMRFRAHGVSAADFDAWVKQAKGAGGMLDRATYLALERPSEKEPVRRFAAIDPGLFDAVLNMCVEPGKMCMRDMMGIDRDGGMGHEGAYNIKRLSYDKFAARGLGQPVDRAMVGALCAPTSMADMRPDAAKRINLAPLTGAGLRRPNQTPAPSIVTAEATLPTARPRS
ncbi:ubiquinol oxidase subunit II [Sphingomonas sp. CJ20]